MRSGVSLIICFWMTMEFCGAEEEVVSSFRYTSTTRYVYCFVIDSKKNIECEYQLIKCILGSICRWLCLIEKSILNLSWQTEKQFVIRNRVYRRDHRVNALNIDCSRLNLNIRRSSWDFIGVPSGLLSLTNKHPPPHLKRNVASSQCVRITRRNVVLVSGWSRDASTVRQQ